MEDLASQRQSERLKDLRRALLVLHSPEDTIVDIDHARRIFDAAGYPKAFVSLDGVDHLLLRADDAAYAAGIIAAWAGRHLEATVPAQATVVRDPSQRDSRRVADGASACGDFSDGTP
jgi:putative redox protein